MIVMLHFISPQQQFRMGSENSKFLSQQELPHQYRPHKQLTGVYESILNGARLQKHKISLNSEAQISYQKQIFVFRRMHSDRLISAHFFQKFIPNHFCNMSYEVCFFTEHPSYCLSLDLVIPIERGFHLLIQSLKGFDLLFTKFGPFSVGFENIFFDCHHQLKVWISPDLGKTRLQARKDQINEQKMIMDVFRIYDQIKDERNSQISFSNYLRRFKQKYFSIITFKNIINFLVDEASKYFTTRSKPIEFRYVEKKQPQVCFFRNSSNMPKYSNKQNSSNIISLKQKNRDKSKKPSTVILKNFQTNASEAYKLNQTTNENKSEKQKKSKRHNSQEDYHPNREINFYRDNHLNIEGVRTPHRNTDNTLFLGQGNRFTATSPANTIRVFRRSVDELDKPIQPIVVQQHKTKRTCIKRINKDQMSKRLNIVQTQIVKEDLEVNKSVKMVICRNFQEQFQRKVYFDSAERAQQNKYEINQKFVSPIRERNQSFLMLSNLQTIKSIIHSEYSDMDSDIRNDLRNLGS